MANANGAVTGSTAEAVAAGERILGLGGNAVDAAVAAALASCVADPCNTGLGGFGGHMIVSSPGQVPVCIDFNLWAPVAAMQSYRGCEGLGAKASVIPNVVAGLSTALQEFGSLNWADVLAPAIELADDGLLVSVTLENALEDVKDATFVDECFRFEPAQDSGGLRVRQLALARTLRQLAVNGPRWFYEGPIAALGSRCLSDAGHEITAAQWGDALDAVTIGESPALRANGVELFSSPLGNSGSICMFAAVAAAAEIGRTYDLDSPSGICRWAERIAAAWSYRFGVADGNTIGNDEIENWIARTAAFRGTNVMGADVGHTCHINAADRNGMLVATTMTHGMLWFGGRWALPNTGIIMNYGGRMVCQPAPTIVDGRVRGVTNMSPTIALSDDGVAVAIGSPGARRIGTIVGAVLARHLFSNVPLQEAIALGRFHAEGRDRATLERARLPSAVETAMQASFASVGAEVSADYYGPCTAIRRDGDGSLTLGLDDRWRGYGSIVS